ncbi:hypothetical protein DUNSADRAFT_3004 [Dunaliella salina]|uniref:Uncharacterized protein n=1 Tax=Dunaliella salina TaxID=3046 RepID=A0ABQ7GUR7_DUNSA|nr:hypothetical protein DUNSADRAFT_3004 [Dunaliella salina]|eukprot:KAF5838333.1 hypothetical protein DUNSADRAFT_3004 [Dunaliella salina]
MSCCEALVVGQSSIHAIYALPSAEHYALSIGLDSDVLSAVLQVCCICISAVEVYLASGPQAGKCNPMGCACCCTNTADLENSPMPPPLSTTEMTENENGADDAYTPPPKQEGGRGAEWDSNHDTHPVTEDTDSSPPEYRTPVCVPVPWGAKHFDPQAPTATTVLAGIWFPRLILPWYGKVIVFMIEAAGLACAIYGCTKVYQDFRPREWFLPEGSWLLEAFQIEDTYFGGSQTAVDLTNNVRMLAQKAAPQLNGMAFSRNCGDALLRELVRQHSPRCEESFYNYDGFDVVTSLTLRNVITAAVAVFIVMLILLANIPAALLVLAMIVLCDVGLFGFMWWANLTFNIITFIIL